MRAGEVLPVSAANVFKYCLGTDSKQSLPLGCDGVGVPGFHYLPI